MSDGLLNPKPVQEWDVYYQKAILDDGRAFFPEKLPLEALETIRRTQGSYMFANQYLNQIIPEDEMRFKKEWFRYYNSVPKNRDTVIFVDPAIGQEDHHDFTGICVVHGDEDMRWYVEVAKRLKMTPTQIVGVIFELCEMYKPRLIGIEDVAYQKAMLYTLLEEMKIRKMSIPVVGVKPPTDKTKEMKIMSVLVPRMEYGRIFFNQGLHDLEHELLTFPRGAHDDICFVSGTKIATPFGDKNIEQIAVGDRVITPFGVRKVLDIGSREAEVTKKMGLTGTPNHPVFVSNIGLVELQHLDSSHKLIKTGSWSSTKIILQKLLNLMELNSVLMGRDAITLAVTRGNLKVSTSTFGKNIIKLLCQKGSMSITWTLTNLIMTRLIWSVYRLSKIGQSLKRTIQLPKLELLKKVGQTVRENIKASVLFVLKIIRPSGPTQSIAQGSVKTAQGPSELRRERVYNLTISIDHCYFANGVLVSNCDALSMVDSLMSYPAPERKPNVRPHPSTSAYEKNYIKSISKRS